jgi:hypothetical protein
MHRVRADQSGGEACSAEKGGNGVSTDWIKMRVDLRTHPKVVRMASALKADKLRVIGGLFAVWSIFDAHSSDGILEGYTFESIDDELHWKGFAKAMAGIEWLTFDPEQGDGLLAPRFEEHNGQSAKRRAMETERKRLEREAEKAASDAKKAATKAGQLSASDADKSVTREEKRREEKEIPPALRVPPTKTAARGSRLPEGWDPEQTGMAFAEQQGLRNGRAAAELAKFRDHWAAQPGQKGVKADWQAAWRNWVRRATEGFGKGGATPGGDDMFRERGL